MNNNYPMVYYKEWRKKTWQYNYDWVYNIAPKDPFKVFAPNTKTTYVWGKKPKTYEIEIVEYYKTEAEAVGMLIHNYLQCIIKLFELQQQKKITFLL